MPGEVRIKGSQEMAEPKTHRKRRRWPWLLLALLAAGVWLGRFAYLRITLRPQPRVAYWDAELARLFPAPPDALPVAQVTAVLASRPFETDPRITSLQLPATQPYDVLDCLKRDWNSPRPEMVATKAVLADSVFENARTTLETVLSRSWHIPISSYLLDDRPSAYLPDAWQWAKWLVVHSYWSHSEGRTGEAVQDWHLIFALACQLRAQAGTISHLVAMANESLAAQEMILAAREDIGPLDLHALIKELDAVPRVGAIRTLVAGEHVRWMCWLEHLYVPEPYGWMDVTELARVSAVVEWGFAGNSAPARIWNLTSPLFHDLSTARANVTRRLDAYQACRDMASTAERAAAPFEQDSPFNVLDGTFDLPLTRSFQLHFRSLTAVEGALASLGLSEYRRRHGHYPESLDQLMPDILPRVPIDYGDRQPLRYRRTEDDYLLYSVWSNGVDGGGIGDPYSSEPPDYVFSALRRRLED